MAKRKRLTPALIGGSEQALIASLDPVSERPPIARIAAEAADHSAFEDVSRALTEAREEGRLIVKLPLDAVETAHLVRDRVAFDLDDMAALETSLRARGQQVPVEVVLLDDAGDDGAGEARYGLISGLRRVMALKAIGATEVLALVRQPETSAEAYLAMVEENEIRAGISFYERARLASEAARLGLYPNASAAIAALFSTASPAKRSKIGSFVRLHEALGGMLRFPAAIPERLGLALVAVLDGDARAAVHLTDALTSVAADDAASERAALETALERLPGKAKTGKAKPNATREIAKDLKIQIRQGRVVLSGAGVTDGLQRDLEAWLVARGAR
ncbi:MAG: ParB N-terminal domain-containing protein, partial [Pseudomonadota bacterium]